MKIRSISLAVLAALALAACGQTGSDPAVTTAPPSASNAPAPDASAPAGTVVESPAAPPSYQQDTAAPADQVAAPADAALASCADLDTAQRDACELQARQGLDGPQSGVLDPSDPAQTPPTDRVLVDSTAAQDDEDDDY